MTEAVADARVRSARPLWILAGLIAAYIAVFGALTWRQQSNYGTFGFDMGIYDQGIWLSVASRNRS